MIERHLPDGQTVVTFPDSMSEDEINAVLRDYVRSLRAATAPGPRTGAIEEGGAPTSAEGKPPIQRPPTGPDEASEPAPAPVPGFGRAFVVVPFTNDTDEPTPEQIRERAQRREQPARLDPPDDFGDGRFRDNSMNWSIWSGRRYDRSS